MTAKTLEHEVVETEASKQRAAEDEFQVCAIDHESESECYVTLFTGPGAKERAHEYADWKNQGATE